MKHAMLHTLAAGAADSAWPQFVRFSFAPIISAAARLPIFFSEPVPAMGGDVSDGNVTGTVGLSLLLAAAARGPRFFGGSPGGRPGRGGGGGSEKKLEMRAAPGEGGGSLAWCERLGSVPLSVGTWASCGTLPPRYLVACR